MASTRPGTRSPPQIAARRTHRVPGVDGEVLDRSGAPRCRRNRRRRGRATRRVAAPRRRACRWRLRVAVPSSNRTVAPVPVELTHDDPAETAAAEPTTTTGPEISVPVSAPPACPSGVIASGRRRRSRARRLRGGSAHVRDRPHCGHGHRELTTRHGFQLRDRVVVDHADRLVMRRARHR